MNHPSGNVSNIYSCFVIVLVCLHLIFEAQRPVNIACSSKWMDNLNIQSLDTSLPECKTDYMSEERVCFWCSQRRPLCSSSERRGIAMSSSPPPLCALSIWRPQLFCHQEIRFSRYWVSWFSTVTKQGMRRREVNSNQTVFNLLKTG